MNEAKAKQLRKKSPISRAPLARGLDSIDELMRLLQYNYGYHPVNELMTLLASNEVEVKDRIRIAFELMQYMYPKQKAVTQDNKGEVFNVNVIYEDKADAEALKEQLAITPIGTNNIADNGLIEFKFTDDEADD